MYNPRTCEKKVEKNYRRPTNWQSGGGINNPKKKRKELDIWESQHDKSIYKYILVNENAFIDRLCNFIMYQILTVRKNGGNKKENNT